MVPSYNDFINEKHTSQGIDLTEDLLGEIGKVLQAAVINRSFRDELLRNPLRSIESGYFGESFHIPEELLKRISCIKSNTLENFSEEILHIVDGISITELVKVPVY
jgi:hypothetical protein